MALSGSVTTNAYLEGRYYTLSWSATQSVANNTSTISWTLSCAGGLTYYAERTVNVTIDGQSVYSKSDRVYRYPGVIQTGTLTLNHAANGTKSFTINVQAAVYQSTITCSGTGTFTLNTIPRASTLSVGTLTMGTAGTINIARASSSFTHTIEYRWGDVSTQGIASGNGYTGVIASKTSATSVSWTPPLTLANVIPSASLGVGTLICTTYNGNTQVGRSSVQFTCNIPDSMIPTLGTLSVTVDNSSNSVVQGWGICLQGVSKAKLSCGATGSYKSTINNFIISGGYSSTISGNTLSYTGGVLSTSGSQTFTVQAVDSRGKISSPKSTTLAVKPYSAPIILSFTAQRSSSDSTKIIIKSNWSHASVTNASNVSVNNSTATLYYKQKNSTSWTTYGTISASQKNTSITLSNTYPENISYDFKLSVTDTVGNTIEKILSISTMDVFLDFHTGGDGLGIGTVIESIEEGYDGILKIKNTWDFQAFGRSFKNTPQYSSITTGSNAIPVYLSNGVLTPCSLTDMTLKGITTLSGTTEFGTSGNYNIDSGGLLKTRRIELYDSIPLIDFHFDRNSADYTSRIAEEESGELYFRRWASSSGAVCYSGGWQTLSSVKIKDDILPITYNEAETAIMKLAPKTFIFKGNTKRTSGLIAEETLKTLPHIVNVPKSYNPEDENPDMASLPSIEYSQIIPYLIKMIQCQHKQILDLQKQINIIKEGLNGGEY